MIIPAMTPPEGRCFETVDFKAWAQEETCERSRPPSTSDHSGLSPKWKSEVEVPKWKSGAIAVPSASPKLTHGAVLPNKSSGHSTS